MRRRHPPVRALTLLSVGSLVLTIALSLVTSWWTVREMETSRDADNTAALAGFLTEQFRTLSDLAVSYAFWTETSQALYSDYQKTGTISEDVSASWLGGNGDVNDLAAIIFDQKPVLVGGIRQQEFADLWADSDLKLLLGKFQQKPETSVTGLVHLKSSSYLVALYPVGSDDKTPLHPGTELFARRLEDRIGTLGTYLNAQVTVRDQPEGEGLSVELPGAKPDSLRWVQIVSRQNFASALALPLGVSLGFQAFVMVGLGVMFAYVLMSLRRLGLDQADKARALDHYRTHEAEISTSLKGLAAFFDKLTQTHRQLQVQQEASGTSFQHISETFEQESQNTERSRRGLLALAEEQDRAHEALQNDSATLSSVAAVLGQMDAVTATVREGANRTAGLGEALRLTSEEGRQALVVHGQQIDKLREGSEQIADLARLITDISARTNLLSINAAIEAARAGSQGRGFSVVAQEIRALSANIQERIREIEAVVSSSREGVAEAETTLKIAAGDFERMAALAVENQAVQVSLEQASGRQAELGQNLTERTHQLEDGLSSLNQLLTTQNAELLKLEKVSQDAANGAEDSRSALSDGQRKFEELSGRLRELEVLTAEARDLLTGVERLLSEINT